MNYKKEEENSQDSVSGERQNWVSLGKEYKTYFHPPQLYTDTDKSLQPLRKGRTEFSCKAGKEQQTHLHPEAGGRSFFASGKEKVQ